MNPFDSNKKYKRPKQVPSSTTSSGPSASRTLNNVQEVKPPESLCPLLAKDSEWVDILQNAAKSSSSPDEEEVLQLVECEDGPQLKPLAIMFPGLIDKDPQTLQGVLNKAMSTTEVTRHLVDLGQKANCTFMKKADRLIPRDKQWLESLTENTNSLCSLNSDFSDCVTCDSETGDEIENKKYHQRPRKTFVHLNNEDTLNFLEDTIADESDKTIVLTPENLQIFRLAEPCTSATDNLHKDDTDK